MKILPETETIAIEKLKVDGDNPNKMTNEQLDALVRSVEKYGFIVPVITNQDLLIVDGEQRLQAAQKAGWKEIPVVRLPIKDIDRRLLRQALNKLKGVHDPDLDLLEYQKIVNAGELSNLSELLATTPTSILKFIENEDIPANLVDEDDKNLPPTLKIIFKTTEQLEQFLEEHRQHLNEIKAKYSVRAGEL